MFHFLNCLIHEKTHLPSPHYPAASADQLRDACSGAYQTMTVDTTEWVGADTVVGIPDGSPAICARAWFAQWLSDLTTSMAYRIRREKTSA